MAITETKMIQVPNNESVVNESNERWGCFGWNVLSVQVTHSQDSKTVTQGLDYYTGDSTVITTTIEYVTITYQRDKGMKNYAQIVALEKEYDNAANEIWKMKCDEEFKFFYGWLITILLIVMWPIGIAYCVYKVYEFVKKNKKKEENKPKIEAYRRRMSSILEEASAMCFE